MTEMQGKLDTVTASGTAGGGLVSIQLNGKLEMTAVEISPELLDSDDRTMLGDLIRAAYADASVKIKEKIREEFSSITGGIDIPPGFMGM